MKTPFTNNPSLISRLIAGGIAFLAIGFATYTTLAGANFHLASFLAQTSASTGASNTTSLNDEYVKFSVKDYGVRNLSRNQTNFTEDTKVYPGDYVAYRATIAVNRNLSADRNITVTHNSQNGAWIDWQSPVATFNLTVPAGLGPQSFVIGNTMQITQDNQISTVVTVNESISKDPYSIAKILHPLPLVKAGVAFPDSATTTKTTKGLSLTSLSTTVKNLSFGMPTFSYLNTATPHQSQTYQIRLSANNTTDKTQTIKLRGVPTGLEIQNIALSDNNLSAVTIDSSRLVGGLSVELTPGLHTLIVTILSEVTAQTVGKASLNASATYQSQTLQHEAISIII